MAIVTPMAPMSKLIQGHRITLGVSIPHPCGDPHLPPEADRALRRDIVHTALQSLIREVKEPTIFEPPMLKEIATTTT